jgi:hypothetical protein
MEEFAAADYFLFLASELSHEDGTNSFFDWRPWSTVYLHGTPMFLRNAERKRIASQLMKIFKIRSADEFRQRFTQRAYRLDRLFQNAGWDEPVQRDDIERFGTR